MSERHPARARALRLDEARRAIPDLDELKPALDLLIRASRPDETSAWAGSAELATVDARLVAGDLLEAEASLLAAEEAEHGRKLFAAVGRAVHALSSGDPGSCAYALLEAAQLEEDRDRPERTKAYATRAYELARGERDQRPAALALRRYARAARAVGELGEALEGYEQSYRISLAISDDRGAAEAAIGAGNVLEERGRWAEAEAWYRRALDAVAEREEPVPERWHALLNLHIVLRSRGAIRESGPLLEEAARVATLAEGERALPFLENARGQLRMSEGAFAEAEMHFRNGLVHARGARARVTIGVNLAESLLAQGRTLDATEEARGAEREAIAAGLVTRLPEIYRMLGRAVSAAGNADSFVLFERSLEIVRESRLPLLEEALTLQAYARAEEDVGDVRVASALRDEAGRRFAELGMPHPRRSWADVFAPEDGAPSPPPSPSTGSD